MSKANEPMGIKEFAGQFIDESENPLLIDAVEKLFNNGTYKEVSIIHPRFNGRMTTCSFPNSLNNDLELDKNQIK